ncbi:TPA: vomeronasal 1 receptor, D9-like [Bos taurus]|nr:TPA: vomeronasal 1 receptor, D9-like [Bos taurus]
MSIFEPQELQRDQRYLNRPVPQELSQEQEHMSKSSFQELSREQGRGKDPEFFPSVDPVIIFTASFHLQDTDILSMSIHRDALRNPGEAAVTTIFLFQVVVGALGNVILFIHSISPILFGQKKRGTDVILTHSVLANLLIILFSGIPRIMAVFVLRKPLNSLLCKFVYYIQRMARSTALCSTYVLSTYQSFTLTPRRAKWILMNICIPLMITSPENTRNDTDNQEKCSDAVFLTLMVWSSGSMVLLLLRHRQRVQHIHSATGHHRCPLETRAAHNILMLVVTFVIFYLLNSIFSFHISAFLDSCLWLIQTSSVLASCFPTVSTFQSLLRDPKTPRFCS